MILCSSLIGDEKMAKLRLSALNNDKPVKVSVELPATVHRDLLVYAEILATQTGEQIDDPNRLIAPMLARFMSTDRAFVKSRKSRQD